MKQDRNLFGNNFQVPKGRVNKNIDDWIDKAYELNKEKIDSKTGGIRAGSKAWFRDTVNSYIREDGMTPSEAVKYVGKSEVFRTKAERQLENVWTGIRKNPQTWRRFKNAAGISNLGQVDWNELDYARGETGQFVYAGKVLIDIENSPYEIRFTII